MGIIRFDAITAFSGFAVHRLSKLPWQ